MRAKNTNSTAERKGKTISHFVQIDTQIKDISALATAVRELGCTLALATTGIKLPAKGWYGRETPCDGVITIAGSNYQVGLVRQPSGDYAMTADWTMCNVLRRAVGRQGGKLLQMYGLAVATKAAQAKGYQVRRQPGKNGAINLVIGVP